MNIIFYFWGFAFAIIIILLSYLYWENNYKKKSINISYKKYNEYIKNKYVYFCYNDDNFILANQPKKIITIKNDILRYDNTSIQLDLIKEIRYTYLYPFKLNRYLFEDIKVYIYLKNGEVINLIPPRNMEIWYKISFVLVVSMIINNYVQNKFNLLTHLNKLKVK